MSRVVGVAIFRAWLSDVSFKIPIFPDFQSHTVHVNS